MFYSNVFCLHKAEEPLGGFLCPNMCLELLFTGKTRRNHCFQMETSSSALQQLDQPNIRTNLHDSLHFQQPEDPEDKTRATARHHEPKLIF